MKKKIYQYKRFWLLLLFLAYLLLGFFYVPNIIQQQIKSQLKTNLNMQTEMSKVHFNPLSFTTQIEDLKITDANEQEWYQSKQTGINFDPSHLLWGEWKFSDLNLQQPKITLVTDTSGQVLIPAMAELAESQESKETINFSIDQITLSQGQMNLQANNIKQDFSIQLKTIEISHDQFSLSDIDTHFDIKVITEHDEILSLIGSYNFPQQKVQSQLKLTDWQATTLNKVLPDNLLVTANDGTLQAEGQLDWQLDEKPILAFSDINLENIDTQWQENVLVNTLQAGIQGVQIDTQAQTIGIETIESSNGNWQLNWPINHVESSTTSSVESAETAWKIDIKNISFTNWPVNINDQSIDNNLALNIDQLNLSNVNNSNLPFNANTKIGFPEGGSLELDSEQQITPLNVKTDLTLNGMTLAQVAPWIADQSGLVFTQGTLNSKQNIQINQDDFILNGDLSVADAILENVSAQPVADWAQLNIATTAISSKDKTIVIDQISLDQANGNLIIDADKNINIQNLKPDNQNQSKTSDTNSDWIIKVGAIDIKDTSTVLIDESISPTVKTSVSELNGQIKGLSSESLSKADVSLKGKFNQFSPLAIEGKINPLSSDAYTDLKVKIQDLDLLAFSPYAIQTVAFPINGGKLDLELDYSLNKNELRGKNNLLFKQFKLGAKKPSPNAVDLPLKLAVSLLTDLNGEMKINLPVSGNIDDPEFSYGSLIGKAIFKLITSIVASPFKILGALIPNPDPNLSDIQFASGSAELLASEQNKLNQIVEIMTKKPKLNLQLNPQIDANFDTLGLKKTALLQQTPFEAFDPQDTQVTAWLEAQLTPEVTPEELATYKNETDAIDYRLIWEALIERQVVTDEQLSELTQQRNLNIKNYLIENAGVSAEKIFVENMQPQNNNQSLIKIGVTQ